MVKKNTFHPKMILCVHKNTLLSKIGAFFLFFFPTLNLQKDCMAFAAAKPVQIRQKETVILIYPQRVKCTLTALPRKQCLSAPVLFAHI